MLIDCKTCPFYKYCTGDANLGVEGARAYLKKLL